MKEETKTQLRKVFENWAENYITLTFLDFGFTVIALTLIKGGSVLCQTGKTTEGFITMSAGILVLVLISLMTFVYMGVQHIKEEIHDTRLVK